MVRDGRLSGWQVLFLLTMAVALGAAIRTEHVWLCISAGVGLIGYLAGRANPSPAKETPSAKVL